ncbi:MAG: tryptophan-rich sensory protein [Burkholderiales bacterium]|nr:MAG: tryptophan-rich sensory protein [Burkholderiales bacterium]
MTGTNRRRWVAAAVAFGGAAAVAFVGSLLTDIGPWYQALQKPRWQPPDWLFGPVWTTIFACIALAALLAWRRTAAGSGRAWLLTAFAVNALLNVTWSLLFFALRRPDWALAEIGLLWVSIGVLVLLAGRRDRRAGWLLAPYLLWVGFAAALNAAIVRLNGPFAAG